MKGVIFTEFMDFVAASHGDDLVDQIIEDATLPNGGAYTSVGTYPYQEMQRLIIAFADRSRTSTRDLLKDFGRHLCSRLLIRFPEFFESSSSLFDFIESIDGYIHIEVRKLYPDAELPKFRTNARDEDRLEIDYASCRPLEALAEGMILGAAAYYGEQIVISSCRFDTTQPVTRFLIQHAA